MPTGYTSDIYNGKKVTFQQFVLQCARAFGALVTMRDDPMDAAIPDEFKPSDYHEKELEVARRNLKTYEAKTETAWKALADKTFMKEIKDYEEAKRKQEEMDSRYDAMLEQVAAWEPPTSEHEELKSFMKNQLLESKRFDSYVPDKPRKQLWEMLKAKLIADAKRDIAYHEKEHAGEVDRCAARTKWVRELRESLDGVSAK